MKVIVAIDSFKGSMGSIEAGNAVKEGILRAKPNAKVLVKPLADGGEGTIDALLESVNGKRIDVKVTGPLGDPVNTYYGYIENTKTAIIEMASAAGIMLVPDDKKNPFSATTYGVGEMILDALNKGCRKFIIGIGGSATNDAGIGMLSALGVQFTDDDGNLLSKGINDLKKITGIDISHVSPYLKECSFSVACDVTNPLCGEKGATYVFGSQKGIQDDQKKEVDESMQSFAQLTKEVLGNNYSETKGAGAAGGLGFALLSYLNAELVSGIDLILSLNEFEKELYDTDIVVTGEGRLDYQTAMGKAPIGIAKLAKKHNVKVLAFAGSLGEDVSECNRQGIDAFFSITRGVTTLKDAMLPKTAQKNMTLTVEQVFRLL